MSNITECIQYLLESEEQHYIEYVTSEFPDLLSNESPPLELLNKITDINWIKKNIEAVNHIYMKARLAEEELNVKNIYKRTY